MDRYDNGSHRDPDRHNHAHPYQIETIYHGIRENDTAMYLVRKTSDGKSLVPQTIAFFRGGISVTLVPLIGLGCHQADKSSVAEHNLEAYHVDEYHGEDAKRLCKRLNGMSTEEAKEITISCCTYLHKR